MQTRKLRLSVLTIILISIGMMACTMGSGMFTEEELNSMYQIVVSRDGSTLDSGARISTATALGLSVVGIDGAPEADSIELLLSYPDGALAASILFATAGTEAAGTIVVKDFESDVPPFTMPANLPDGYYTLLVRIKNAAGEILSRRSTVVLLYEGLIPAPSLAVYPGFVIAGEVSLIRLVADFPAAIDPWIQWSVDGRVLSAGFYSNHADRLAWRAPATSGVYLAKAEIFPFMPPSGFEIAPLATAEIRLPLSTNTPEADPLATSGAWSRLTFDGNLVDRGSRERTEEPVALGLPTLETYSSGFGYLLGNEAGFASASSLLPIQQAGNVLSPFTALFLLAQASDDSSGGSGKLLDVPAAGDFPGMVLGVEKGFPYFKSGDSTIRSNLELRASPTRLAVYVAPAANGVFVQFYLDEQPAGSGTLVSPLFQALPDTCVISGPGGYVAIFDELRIFAGPYPAFRLAELAAKGKALIGATGFEGGILGSDFAAEGDTIKIGHGSLTLGAGSSLIIGTGGMPSQGISLTFDCIEGKAMASIELADGNSLVIDTEGNIRLDGGVIGFSAVTDESPRVSIAVEPTEDGLRVYGSNTSGVLLGDTALAPGAKWILSSIDEKPVVISNVSISVFQSPLASSMRKLLLPNSAEPTVPDAGDAGLQQQEAALIPAGPPLASVNR